MVASASPTRVLVGDRRTRGPLRARSVPLARRNILSDRRRLVVSVLGVGASMALILLLQGLWGGMRAQITTFIDNSGAQLFVGDADMADGGLTSVIPLSVVAQIRAMDGVERADPAIVRYAVLVLHGRGQFLSIVGHRPGGLGGPWRIAEGRTARASDEAVVDRILAKEHGLGVGDQFSVMGSTFRLVGLSAGTRSWMFGYVFVTHETAERAFRTPGQTGYVLIETDDREAVVRQLAALPGTSFLPTADLAEKTRLVYARVIKPIVDLMVLIAFVAGTIIVALMVYSAVVEKLREYGIARALGAGTRRLFRIVLGQTLTLASLGIVAGFGMYGLFGWIITALRPRFWLVLSTGDVGLVVMAAVVMALVAAVFPTHRLSRLDPASVYRESAR